jgi:hypothetical protein
MSQDADKRRTATVKQTVQQRRKSIDTCGEEQQRKESSILELLYHRKIKQPAWTAQTTHMDSKVRDTILGALLGLPDCPSVVIQPALWPLARPRAVCGSGLSKVTEI